MPLYYDLHTHTYHSDGLLAPSELIGRARAAGVRGIAVTDHDSTSGLDEARASAHDVGIELIPGVELSVTWSGQTIHILGLNIDAENRDLQAGLGRLQEARRVRGRAIGERLAKVGIPDAYEGALERARGIILGRTHFARYLVDRGYAKDLRQAFVQYLRKGKPGHVPIRWATMSEAVGWICAAGGVAVIAHPARYKLSPGGVRRLLAEFKVAGGLGIEVVSSSHSPANAEHFGRMARESGLLASAGSDYHGPMEARMEVGHLPPLPTGCTPVWSAWAASGVSGATDDAGRKIGSLRV